MGLKLLLFGNSSTIHSTTAKIRGGRSIGEQQQVKVETLSVLQKEYLVFSIFNRSLITTQATGTNGLIFFLESGIPLYEQKQFLFDLLREKQEFDGLPIVIAFQRDQEITIKDVINYFELFKVKDRPSMIKQVSYDQPDTISDIFKWIDSQVDFRKSKTFDAQPRVVKIKPKYRQSDPEASEQKYTGLMKQRNFKSKAVKDQEQIYIVKEKDRIKDQNMKAQLANFNKNKKKMAPYDIKPTPNPKIQPNLHFFLKDPKNEKEAQVNIKIQTDQFKPRPKEKPYVPKKTGVNIATQIQQDQLFDFNKQVVPILEILTTKALETAALQLQEQQQFIKMAKYKTAYNQRVKKQHVHEEKKIQNERDVIAQKAKLLESYRLKDQSKRNAIKKTIHYSIANNFLANIYNQSCLNVYNNNYYANEFDHLLRTDYLNSVILMAAESYQSIKQKQSVLQGVFQKDCLQPLIEKGKVPKKLNNQLRSQRKKRRTNKEKTHRSIHVYYEHSDVANFSSFTKFISKNFDGTLQETVKAREDQIQQISDKVSTGELQEDQLLRIKNIQNEQLIKDHASFLIGSQDRICFTITSNRYQKVENRTVFPGVIGLNRENEPIFTKIFDKDSQSHLNYVKHVKELRNPLDFVNMDQGIILDLKKVPDQVKSFIFVQKIQQANKYSGEGAKKFQASSYGIETFDRAVSLHRENIGEKMKWDQIIKGPVEGQQNQNNGNQDVILVTYIISRKFDVDLWFVEDVKYISKPIKPNQCDSFMEWLARYYKQSTQIMKLDEDEEPARQVSSKKISSRSNKRIKSKKQIEQEQNARRRASMSQIINRALSSVYIDLSWDFGKTFDAIANSIKQWKEFIEHCGQLGWQLKGRNGQKIQSMEQIRKFSKLGDIIVQKVVPKIEQPQEGQQAQKNEGGQENKDE